MFENQIATLTTILKDKDIHNYMGDTFWKQRAGKLLRQQGRDAGLHP